MGEIEISVGAAVVFTVWFVIAAAAFYFSGRNQRDTNRVLESLLRTSVRELTTCVRLLREERSNQGTPSENSESPVDRRADETPPRTATR